MNIPGKRIFKAQLGLISSLLGTVSVRQDPILGAAAGESARKAGAGAAQGKTFYQGWMLGSI